MAEPSAAAKSPSTPTLFNDVSSRVLRWAGSKLGKNLPERVEDIHTKLSPSAKLLVQRSFEGLSVDQVLDHHAHIVGYGSGATGCCVADVTERNPRATKKLTLAVMAEASGVKDPLTADQDYVARLLRLVRAVKPHGKHVILAFCKHYNEDGSVNAERTEFYTPNEYVHQLAVEHPDAFLPSCSVHPYQSDCVEQLELWASRGVKLIKWLPNSHGMDPLSDKCLPFYAAVKRLDMVILSHAGDEKAVDSHPEAQALGNPLLLRGPLRAGCKVILAHCASLGSNEDLDAEVRPGGVRPRVPNFQLFLRMMSEPQWEGLLFADISATTQFNRIDCVATLLKRTDIHHRLVYGTDYPLVCVGALIHTRPFVKRGMLTPEERTLLNEIFRFNPLLFDFVLKRTIRGPEGQRFADSLFCRRPELDIFSEWEAKHSSPPVVALIPAIEEAMTLEECIDRIKHVESQLQALASLQEEKRAELQALHARRETLTHAFGEHVEHVDDE